MILYRFYATQSYVIPEGAGVMPIQWRNLMSDPYNRVKNPSDSLWY